MRTFLPRLAISASCLLIAAAAPSKSIDERLKAVAEKSSSSVVFHNNAQALQTQDVGEVIYKAARASKSFESVVAEVAQQLSIPVDAARPLVRGVLPLLASDLGQKIPVEASLEDLKTATKLSGQHPAVLAAFISFVRDAYTGSDALEQLKETQLDEVLGQLPAQPMAKGRLLLQAANAAQSEETRLRALKENPALLCFIDDDVHDAEPSAALLLEKALTYGLAHRDACDLNTLGRLSRKTLERQLRLGMTGSATSLYLRLPDDLKSSVRECPPLPPDICLSLAAAFVLEKQPAPARELRDAAIATRQRYRQQASLDKERDPDDVWRTDLWSSLPQLISFGVSDVTGDPFDAIVSLFQRHSGGETMLPVRLLAARVAAQRYPTIALEWLDQAEISLLDTIDPVQSCLAMHQRWRDEPVTDTVRADCEQQHRTTKQADLAALQDIDAKPAIESLRPLLAQVTSERVALEKAVKTPEGTRDPVAATVKRLLEAPRSSVWKESPKPKSKPKAAARATIRPPSRNFRVVRAERYGKRVLAVASSTLYDPAGELSSGGYWLLQSKDNGSSWDAPVYLGLTEYLPYEVVEFSDWPLLEGENLRIEVNVKELDSKRIIFPPIGMRPKREVNGLLITAPLSALTKDSDQDGLTDLAEERLVLDPSNPDTDGDGVPDGVDPLPQVRSSGSPNIRTELMTRIAFNESMAKPIVIGMSGGIGVPENRPDPETRFVVGERTDFGPPASSKRLIVLTKDEYRLAKQKFGPFLPGEVELFLVNEAGTKAYVRWTEHWRGGSFVVEQLKGQWIVHELEAWIT